jgi:hypothetical protein
MACHFIKGAIHRITRITLTPNNSLNRTNPRALARSSTAVGRLAQPLGVALAMLTEDEKWFEVTLRFFGDSLRVEEIESKLGIKPSYFARKGEHIQKDPRFAKHRSNIWRWNFTSDSSKSFEIQLVELLDTLEPLKAKIDDILSIEGVSGELFLGFSSGNGQGGAYFSPSLLARLAKLGLGIELDLYPPNVNE